MITIEELQEKKHLHFIGIGGSGMYPIVQILHAKGYHITGSDNNKTETTDAIEAMGIKVYFEHRPENIKGADLIIYTAAVLEDNPELVAAKNSGAYVAERSEMLGLVTRLFTNAICVSGTHGKTTASSMLTQILLAAGEDISCVIGGKLPVINGSGRFGQSDTMVCEACEFLDHFLKLSPDTAVILNIDADHLDYFGTLDNIKESFRRFAEMTTGSVIANGDDENTMSALSGLDKKIITFGLDRSCDYSAKIIKVRGLTTIFTLYYKGNAICDLEINVPGKHNVYNALAAIAAARTVGATYEDIGIGLSTFHGAKRRFELIGKINGISVVDDYAHHPAEIAATLKAAKELGFKRVWAVFQPFTYSRTEILLDEFAEALRIADKIVLTDIMAGRETNDHGIYTDLLAEKLPGAIWFRTPHPLVDMQMWEQRIFNFDQVADTVAENAESDDIIITMGCGDVYKAAKLIVKKLEEINNRSSV